MHPLTRQDYESNSPDNFGVSGVWWLLAFVLLPLRKRVGELKYFILGNTELLQIREKIENTKTVLFNINQS